MQLMLGDFLFQFDTASYQTLNRTSPRRFAENERVGAAPVLQDLGEGVETMSLAGTILPELMGPDSSRSLDIVRDMKSTGKPHILMNVEPGAWQGSSKGKWVVENIDENQSKFFGAMPQKIDFTISLKRYHA